MTFNKNLDGRCQNLSTALTLSSSCRGIVAPKCSGIVTDAINAQSSNTCDILCTKSHVYVDKITKCCALNHIYMSPGLLKNMYVLSSVVGSHFLFDIMPVSISHRETRVNTAADTNSLTHTHRYIYIHIYI